MDLDIALKNKCTDAEINLKLTNMSEQITQLPKDSDRVFFSIRLMVKTVNISNFHLNEKRLKH